MVRITRQNVQQQSRRRGTGSGLDDALQMARAKLLEKDSLVGVLIVLSAGLLFVVYMLWSSASDGNLRADAGEGHPNLHFEDRDSEQYNAIALDIRDTLDCHLLLNSTKESYPLFTEGEGIDSKEAAQSTRRRLTEGVEEDAQAKLGEDERRFGLDDDMEMMDGVVKNPTAKHLFCLAAYASDDRKETGQWKDMIKCDATGSAQRSLLDLWSMAQGEMTPDLLLKVLDMSVENLHTIIKKDLNLWAPREDTGLDYMVTHVNEEEKTVDQGGLYGLDQYLGKEKVFVDVGSCLGTTSMAISLLYPGTRVVSIESASPNWLLQEINFRCNADAFEQQPLIMLSGVGPAHSNSAFARYTWKSDQVTSARAWTPQQEINPVKDIELAVKLRPWHSILAEAEIIHDSSNRAKIDVLNVDCGACEYNLIPSMTDAEFDSITTVMVRRNMCCLF